MIKYILLSFLLLTGCSSKNPELTINSKQLRIIDCNLGVLFAVKHFHNQLYKKVTQEQFDAIWKDCESLGK